MFRAIQLLLKTHLEQSKHIFLIKRKVHMILFDNNGLLPKEDEGIKILDLYRKRTTNRLLRALRKIHLSSFLPFKKIWFGEWANNFQNEKIIILFDTGNARSIINYIRRRAKGARIILWYWGPVEISVPIASINRQSCEVWTFDERDAAKYNLLLNSQFYCKSFVDKYSRHGFDCDAFFIGTEKNRLNELLDLKETLLRKGITVNFHIVKSGSHYANSSNYEYQQQISYEESLELLSKSRCIVDIVSDDQTGLTIRPLEALFFKKKLITNCKDITKYDFYNKNNIFILGVDDIDSIRSFVLGDFDCSNQESLVEKYCLSGWFKRFNSQ